MRTVEMENWNDSDCTNTKKMGHVHETPVDNHGRVISPVESIDMKNDVTYASPTSPASSLSRPRNKQDDCEIGRAR